MSSPSSRWAATLAGALFLGACSNANKGASSSATADDSEPPSASNTYTTTVAAAKSYKVGETGTITLAVDALAGYHVNPDYPYKIVLDAAPGGITYPDSTIKEVKRSGKRATMTVPFKAEKAGKATITGTCSLSVCSEDGSRCVIDKAKISTEVNIEQ